MKIIILGELAFLVAASACGSAQGATDAGTAFAYSSRQQVECNTVKVSELSDAGALYVEAQCSHPDDLPLVGSCSNPGPGASDAILAVSMPLSWQGTIPGPATWHCEWSTGGQAIHVPNGQATICCVVTS